MACTHSVHQAALYSANQTNQTKLTVPTNPIACTIQWSPIQKYYSDKKIETSAGSFCGQKYSIDKGITNRTIGRAYAVIFRYQNPAYTIKKRKRKLLSIGCTAGGGLLATVNGLGFDVAACAPPCLRRGIRVCPCILRLCVYLACGLQVQPLDLSWPCLLRATGY